MEVDMANTQQDICPNCGRSMQYNMLSLSYCCIPCQQEVGTGIKSKECRMCKGRFVADDGQNICRACDRKAEAFADHMEGGGNVTELGPHEYMTVDEMLAVATRDHGMSEAILMGYDKRDGKIIIMSSQLTRAEANYMLDKAKHFALDMED